MSNSWSDIYVQCPFYKEDMTSSIQCEGVQPKTGLRLGFQDCRQKKEYLRSRCAKDYKGCMLYRMLMLKYED